MDVDTRSSVDNELDEDILAEFVMEWSDHVQNAEAALLDLERDPLGHDELDAVFRAFHSIKGGAAFLHQDDLRSLAHRAEGFLDRARSQEIHIVGPNATLALRALDAVRWFTDALRENPSRHDRPDGFEDLLAALSPANFAPGDREEVVVDGEAAPPRKARSDDGTARSVKRDVVGGVGAAGGGNVVRGDPSSDTSTEADSPTVSRAVARPGKSLSHGVAKGPPAAKESNPTIHVRADRLDRLINTIGEVVITQSIINQHIVRRNGVDPVLTGHLSSLGRLTRELHDLSLSMRMVPLHNTFRKMARLVRDLSRKSGKRVDFIAEGEDTEIDRTLVEHIDDPLIHMIRNAIDHGVEPAEERRMAGKPEEGTVRLCAYHADGYVVFELEDDGRGIDHGRVLEKARELGLVDARTTLSPAETIRLLFAPGFSTAGEVTDVSGRGVGMDVVRNNVELMHGSIDIDSHAGRGTCVQIRIPLTLAMMDGLIVKVGREQFVIPTESVEHVLRPGANTVSTVHGRDEMICFRGSYVPVYRLGKLLGISTRQTDATQGLLVVVSPGRDRCALLADGLVGKRQLVVKSPGEALRGVDGFSGVAILDDGRVGIILDPSGLLRLADYRFNGSPDDVAGNPGMEMRGKVDAR